MSTLLKQLQEIVENFQKSHPDGGTFHIAGNNRYNDEAIKALNSLVGIVSNAKLVQLTDRSSTDIIVDVESIPKIQFSYDGGKTWS